MLILLLLICFVVVGLCLADTKAQRRAFLGAIVGVLYLPIGIILAIAKSFK